MRYLLLLLPLAAGCAQPFLAAKADYTQCLREHLKTPDDCEGYRRIWEAERQAKEIEASLAGASVHGERRADPVGGPGL